MSGDHHWPPVKISDLIRESRIKGSNGSNARKLTIRLYGRGIVASSDRGGSEATNYYVRKAGQFAYSKLDCLNGAFGIIPPHLDGYETTLDLPAFDFVGEVDPSWFLKTVARPSFYGRFKFAAIGSRKANRVPTDEFLATRLSLPPLAEQRAIADILDAAEEAVAKTEALIEAANIARGAIVFGHLGDFRAASREVKLGDIVKSLEAGVSVNSEKRLKNEGEIGVLKTSSASFGTFRPDEHKAVVRTEYSRVSTPVRGDCIIISRMNTPELVGANVYVDRTYPDLYLPDRLWLLDVKDRKAVNVRWLALVLSSERFRNRLSALATGTSGTMKNLSKKLVLGLRLKLPPIDEQERIAAMALSIDERLSAELAGLDQLRLFHASLAQELLSGRLRLPDSIIARHRDKAGQAA
ncbi:restriction endonuclease subunit S [Sinorhizobium medicae]|uniref:Type I restriction modification DNA specificity domain-containing protein n=1 Tax=Sinorhizobium medicae TaxID=110321 RepID=A0A508WXK5_9HYPH|nr:restriction endonuclease subunit S [Sinorhizobium medicae]VTZ62301.1 hypothetical protein EMEDMD4_370165 [Sinorhizobium medicae]